ncbi:uncharacterized protein LOC103463287 [Poecilia reticulata]|uniref:uncharacterized protein LOC103463287 n=1 Tax=Poecilia reticulata TaxID=8081 RepID=UPI0007E9633E|nr:PREDICTED: uncharacterized protein LOC103463287 [Poecilia reticulata]
MLRFSNSTSNQWNHNQLFLAGLSLLYLSFVFRSVGGASLPGHLSNPSTRWRRSASPTRRLRFEDETETEAESRYLERQQGTGVQVSKPDLNQLNVRGRPAMMVAMSGAQLDCHLTLRPPVAQVRGRGLNRPLLQVRTEVLKDSYIGCISPADSAEDKAPPTSGSPDGHRRHPIREELHSVVSHPGRFSRAGPSRLSLHRLFSSVKLSKTQTASLDRLVPPVPDRLPSDGRNCSLWKKSPSAQSLSGALGLQMKKSSSVQSFGSEESKNCSVDYRPADVSQLTTVPPNHSSVSSLSVHPCLRSEVIGRSRSGF